MKVRWLRKTSGAQEIEVLGVTLTLREQRQAEQAINWQAQDERDRLRQERKRRKAGIPPRGAQEELEKATGYRDEFGRLNE